MLAELAVGESFKKPAGVRALLTTKFENDSAGRLAFETRGELNNITELLARGALGEKSTTVSLTTSSFDLKGWSGLVPALASPDPSGVLAFEDLSLERSEGAKDRFSGRIALRNVDLALTKSSRIRLRGKGLPGKTGPGDLLVTVEIRLPEVVDEDLLAYARKRRSAKAE